MKRERRNGRDELDADPEPIRLERCAYPGCLRLARNLFCSRHRERTRLDEHDNEPPKAA